MHLFVLCLQTPITSFSLVSNSVNEVAVSRIFRTTFIVFAFVCISDSFTVNATNPLIHANFFNINFPSVLNS
jgi:hypothetical protein